METFIVIVLMLVFAEHNLDIDEPEQPEPTTQQESSLNPQQQQLNELCETECDEKIVELDKL